MADEIDLTLADVVTHMHGMEQRLQNGMNEMEQRLRRDMATKGDIATLTRRLDSMDMALQRLFEKRTQLTERVRVIEEDELPPIKRAVGIA